MLKKLENKPFEQKSAKTLKRSTNDHKPLLTQSNDS